MMESFDLEIFFELVRGRGIAVGPIELARISHVLQGAPEFERDEWRRLLVTVLAKSEDDVTTIEFEFDRFWNRIEKEFDEEDARHGTGDRPIVDDGAAGIQVEDPESTTPVPTEKKSSFALHLGVVVLLIVVGWLLVTFPPTSWLEEPSTSPDVRKPPVESRPSTQPSTAESQPISDEPGADGRQIAREFRVWNPTFRIVARAGFWDRAAAATWPISMAATALLLAFILEYRYRRQFKTRPAPRIRPDGPRWVASHGRGFLRPTLDPDDRRRLVFGIDRYIAEDPSREMDVEKTVAATAKNAGSPEIVRRRSRYPREVWIWSDRHLGSSTARALIDEIVRNLAEAGQPVRTGFFSGLPFEIAWTNDGQAEEEPIDPRFVEGHRQSVILAIVGSGESFVREAGENRRDDRFLEHLKQLAEWPRIVFVDTADGRYDLAALGKTYGIPVIAPAGLASYLGSNEIKKARFQFGRRRISDDLRLIRGAVALSTEPVTAAEVQDLAAAIGVACSADDLSTLTDRPGCSVSRITLNDAERIEALNEFLASDRPDAATGRPPKDGYVAQAVQFHKSRIDRERCLHDNAPDVMSRYRESLARARSELAESLIAIFGDPAAAADKLYALRQTELKPEIEEALAGLCPADWEFEHLPPDVQETLIRLPWALDQAVNSTIARARLIECGLGRSVLTRDHTLRRSGAQSAAVAILLTMASILLIGVLRTGSHDGPPILISKNPDHFDHDVFRRFSIRGSQQHSDGLFSVWAGTPRHLVLMRERVPAGATIEIDWGTFLDDIFQNPLLPRSGQDVDGAEIYCAGTLPQPIREPSDDWPRRSLVVIQAHENIVEARRLAARLLDLGSADRVLIVRDRWTRFDEFMQVPIELSRFDQLLVIAGPQKDGSIRNPMIGLQSAIPVTLPLVEPIPMTHLFRRFWAIEAHEGFAAVTARLPADPRYRPDPRRDPVQPDIGAPHLIPASEIWPSPKWRTETSFLVRMGPARMIHEKTGAEFIEVGGGTFVMGVPQKPSDTSKRVDGELESEKDEVAHVVTLDTFWIAATETTAQQYAKAMGQDIGKGDVEEMPKVNVDWPASKECAERFGGSLPTEAEWEYACRGGTTTTFWFGNRVADLSRFEWAGSEVSSEIRPTAKLRSNPLGIFDLSGNVIEWCHDASKPYPEGPVIDFPSAAALGSGYRVIRGGSARYDARGARSADRDWFDPTFAGADQGFRVVLPSRRHR